MKVRNARILDVHETYGLYVLKATLFSSVSNWILSFGLSKNCGKFLEMGSLFVGTFHIVIDK